MQFIEEKEFNCSSCKEQKESVDHAFRSFENTIQRKFNTLIAELKQLQLQKQKGIQTSQKESSPELS